MTEKAQAGFLGDYEFLNRDFPVPSGTRHTWLLDDVLLTIVIFLGAFYDLTAGIFNLAATGYALNTLNSMNITVSSDDPLTIITRVRGVGGLESGLAGLLVGVYRIARWGRKQRFNGINFQMVLLITTIGRSLQLYIELPGFVDPFPPGFYMLIGRLSIAAFGFLLSLYTYRSSWRWLWEHPL